MKYMLLCCCDERSWDKLSQTEQQQVMHEAIQLVGELKSSGQYLASAPLYPVATATSVRLREGKWLVTDGPFAETHEQIGGFYLIDVPDLDAAIRIAQRHPGARFGTVEIRPALDLADLSTDASLRDSKQQKIVAPDLHR